VTVLQLNKEQAATRLRFISAADGGEERKPAGKLISNIFIVFPEARRGQEAVRFMGNVVLIFNH